jgi:hypothetical protein
VVLDSGRLPSPEAERVVEFPVREQTGVGGNYRSLKLEHQAAVEIELECEAAWGPSIDRREK